jgi:hypothetical protein
MDNKSVIELSKNPIHHDSSKHIDIHYHFIHMCNESGRINIDHVGIVG